MIHIGGKALPPINQGKGKEKNGRKRYVICS